MVKRAAKRPRKEVPKKRLGKKTGGTPTTKGRRGGRRPAKKAVKKGTGKTPAKPGTRKQASKKRAKPAGTTTVKKAGPGGKPRKKTVKKAERKAVPAKKAVRQPKKAPAKKAPARKAARRRLTPVDSTPLTSDTTGRSEPPREAKRVIRWSDEQPEGNGGATPEGKRAPDFQLPDQDGRMWTDNELAGKPYVLYFYPKDDTPGCTKEACAFRDHYESFRARGVPVLGVSADSVASHRKFADKYNLPFPLLSDPDRKLIEALGAWQEKSMYGRKFMGIQRKTVIVGPDGKIVKEYPKVSPEEHATEILSDLERVAER